MSLAFGRYSARSGLRARSGSECGSKPGQPCTHGINLGVEKRTSLVPNHAACWRARNGAPRSYQLEAVRRRRPRGADLRCPAVPTRPPRCPQRFKRGR
eukprot:scaffold56636_cov18-Phaeocystis_antarctica.AAC.1